MLLRVCGCSYAAGATYIARQVQEPYQNRKFTGPVSIGCTCGTCGSAQHDFHTVQLCQPQQLLVTPQQAMPSVEIAIGPADAVGAPTVGSQQHESPHGDTYPPWTGTQDDAVLPGRTATDPGPRADGSSSSSSNESQSVVSELQSRVFWAKVWVVVFTYGFDACAALVFTLSLLGTVQLAVLQGLAVAGAMLGMVCYGAGLVVVPPTMAAYAKLAASREHKGEALHPTKQDDVVRQCQVGSTWAALFYHMHLASLENVPDPMVWPGSWRLRLQAMRRAWFDELHKAAQLPFVSQLTMITTSQLPAAAAVVFQYACFGAVTAAATVTTIIGVPFNTNIDSATRGVVGAFAVIYCTWPVIVHCLALLTIGFQAIAKPPKSDSGFSSKHTYVLDFLSADYAYAPFIASAMLGSLPHVWAWQCWVGLAAKSEEVVTTQTRVTSPANVSVAQLKLSVCATTSRMLLNSWALLEVYWLTEWLRIMLLVAAACIAVAWRLSPAAALQPVPDHMRATMAALSLGVTYIKSVRDKWKLLERGMQQFSYAGAVVDHCQKWLGFPGPVHDGMRPSRSTFGFAEYAERWERVEGLLQRMSVAQLESPPAQQQLRMVQEMLRRANKAVMADNVKACYL